jgi:hypothetical protein
MARFIPVKITKVGASLYIKLPREFVRANNLKAGDMLMPDLSTFKVIRPEDLATLDVELGKAEAAVYEGLEPAE